MKVANKTDSDGLRIAKIFPLLLYCCCAALLLWGGNFARADDSLAALMQRMKTDRAVKIAYQEARTLELMDQPWHGSGYMYSLPPDIMIKEQLKPTRILMGVSGIELLYFDAKNHIRHRGVLAKDDPLSLNIAVFKALMNADQQLLENLYHVEFIPKPEQWIMILKAREDPDSSFKITIFGLPQGSLNKIEMQQVDGDRSEFDLKEVAEGAEVKKIVNRLYWELQSN